MFNGEVSIDIITGFLGSGKTTLLRHILDNGLEGRRVAVVMNELGDVGIDGRVIEGLNVEQMIELGSGCVCCTINRAFGLALQELVETVEPELVIVETTGVAEPDNIAYETRQVGFAVDATITVVDAADFDRHLAAAGAAREQIAAADFVVLSKVDLVGPGRADEAEAAVRAINPRALITRAARGAVDTDVLFGTSARSHLERPHAGVPEGRRGEDHLARDRVSSFVYEPPRPFVRERFERFLEQLPETVYRAKGLVLFTESEWSSLFNFTCGRAEFEWRERVGPDFHGKAVFIGAGAAALRPELTARLDACLA